MNSIQLINTIKGKSEDLQLAIQQLNGELNAIDKELIKKNCIELFELVLKLKTSEAAIEDIKGESAEATPMSATPVEAILEEMPVPSVKMPETEIHKAIIEPMIAIQTSIELPEPEIEIVPENPADISPIQQSFNEFIKQINIEKATLNELEKTTEFTLETPVVEAQIPIETEIKIQAIPPAQTSHSIITPPEFNIDKAVENKRIQKTVMPDPDPVKKVSFNESIAPADPSFNDRLAEKVTLHNNPIIEKSIDAPIENMKTEIGLNKKIAFVNQLFGENVVEYAKAIDKLNQAVNLEEGMKRFQELGIQFNWDSQTNPLVSELKQLLQRRHQA
jgi:hypothetical protein